MSIMYFIEKISFYNLFFFLRVVSVAMDKEKYKS